MDLDRLDLERARRLILDGKLGTAFAEGRARKALLAYLAERTEQARLHAVDMLDALPPNQQQQLRQLLY